MKLSIFGTLNLRDVVNGFVVVFITSILTTLVTSLDAGALPTVAQVKTALIVGLTAGLSYLVKNLLQNSAGQLMKKEPGA